MENDIDLKALQEKGIKGFIRFSIKAEDNSDNEQVHNEFKRFAKLVCGDDYTLAIRMLLAYYEDRGAFEALWEKIKMLETELSEVKESIKPVEVKGDDSKDNGVF